MLSMVSGNLDLECESQLTMTVQDLADSLDRNVQVDGILLAFSKAFDKVPHQRLIEKPSYYGIRGNLPSWIKDFPTHRKQEVVLEGKHSSRSEVTSGVPTRNRVGTASLPYLHQRYNKEHLVNC
jgi:hypothetical protein